jgi:transposase InsO family protein
MRFGCSRLGFERPRRVRTDRRPFPEWADYRRNSIWIYDVTHFAGCPKHAVFAVMDLVTRKWICELVSIEETSTQVQVVFMDALESEGLLALVEARQDTVPADTFPFDAAVDEPELPPILLAVSDNGPQMTSGSTREFMAMCAIAQHFGRPGTPTDQAWIESLFSHIKAEWPHLDRIRDPEVLRAETRRRPPAIQHDPTARRDRVRHPERRARRPRPTDPRRPQTRATTRPLGPNRLPLNPASQSQPPEPVRCGLIRSPICGFDSETPHPCRVRQLIQPRAVLRPNGLPDLRRLRHRPRRPLQQAENPVSRDDPRTAERNTVSPAPPTNPPAPTPR